MKQNDSKHWRSLVVASPFGALALFFAWLFYVRYWKWRDCINAAASSCITPDGDSLIQSGMFWAIPAIFFAVLFFAVLLLCRTPQH